MVRWAARAGLAPLAELVDDLYPRVCWLCGGALTQGATCRAHALPARPSGPRCVRCQAALPPALPDGATCPACRARPPRHGRAVALGDYRDAALRDWILAFKHGGRADLAGPLAEALARRAQECFGPELGEARPAPWLVPVPLHPLRRLERGHDQALLLARGLGDALRLGARRALVRRRPTPPQGAPGARERHVNVAGAFALEPDVARAIVGRGIYLVDDVLTSGATLDEAARVLRRAGARRVDALVLASARGDA